MILNGQQAIDTVEIIVSHPSQREGLSVIESPMVARRQIRDTDGLGHRIGFLDAGS